MSFSLQVEADRNRWLGRLFLLLAALVLAAAGTSAFAADANRIELFVREGCPHCAQAEAFLEQLHRERPELEIVARDVQKEPEALARLQELVASTGGGVPGCRRSTSTAR